MQCMDPIEKHDGNIDTDVCFSEKLCPGSAAIPQLLHVMEEPVKPDLSSLGEMPLLWY